MVAGKYADNKKDGAWIYCIYPGDTIKNENWFNGHRFGEQIEYYLKLKEQADPSVVSKFTFCNLDGEEIFSCEFDIYGNVTKLKGIPFYYAYNKDKFSPNSTFEMVCFFSQLPDCSSEIVIEGNYSTNPSKKIRQTFNNNSSEVSKLTYANKFNYNYRFLKKGLFNWRISYTMLDRHQKVIVRDSSNLPVKVE
jgi:hypothetical protein